MVKQNESTEQKNKRKAWDGQKQIFVGDDGDDDADDDDDDDDMDYD
jgi:hypothetical protein